MPPRLTNFKFIVKDASQGKVHLEVNFDVEMIIPPAFARMEASKWAKSIKEINSFNFFLALSKNTSFINQSMGLPREMLIRDLWINREDKDSSHVYGITSEVAGHRHDYVLDYKGNGATSIAYHPINAAINHKHSVASFAIGSAKSDCYPKCEELYGVPGAPPHLHTRAYEYEKRSVANAKIDPSIVNTYKNLERTVDNRGNIIYLIPISKTFKNLDAVSDLSLFVVPYSSQNKEGFDVPKTETVIKKDIMRGGKITVSKEAWIGKDGRLLDIVSEANGFYKTSNGTTLPVSQNITKTSKDSREVIDARVANRPVRAVENNRDRQLNKSKKAKVPYFTDIFISRDEKERARFFFGLDMLKYVRDNCAYPTLFKGSKVLSRVAAKIEINSFKLTKTRKGSSKIEPSIVVESKSVTPGSKLISRTYSERKIDRKDKLGPDLLDPRIVKGVISELSFDTFNPLGFRYFSGVDESSRTDEAGEFEYTVAIEIVDPTIETLKEVLDRTGELHEIFNDYYVRASRGHYNGISKKFKESFIVLFEKEMKDKIKSSLKEYARLVSFLSYSRVRNRTWQDLYRMIHPRKSSLVLIREFLSSVEDNIAVLQRDYDLTRAGSTNKSVKNSFRAVNRNLGASSRFLRIEKTFESTYDANSVKEHGQKVFDFTDPNKGSLVSMSKRNFISRRQMEFDKYFRDIPSTFTVDGITVSASPDNRYFSPLELLFGEGGKVECGHIPKDTQELQEQNNSIFKISDYNDLEKISHAKKRTVNKPNFNIRTKARRDVEAVELISEVDEKTPLKGLSTGNVLRINQQKQKPNPVVNNITKIVNTSRIIGKNNQVVEKSYYDLKNLASGIRISTNCPPDNITLDSLPVQTKALIIDSSRTGNAGVIAAYASRQENFGWLYQNFVSLYKVEALVGYEKEAGGLLQIKRPIFKTLTEAHLRDQKTYLCRLVREDNKKIGRPNIEELEYPVYNQYFLLTPSSNNVGMPGTQETPTMTTTY